MKTILKTLLFISPFLLASDCGENAPYGAIKGAFSFLIVNEDHENLVDIDNGPYYPDSINVYNNAWELQPLRKINDGSSGWIFDLDFIEGKAPAEVNFSKLDKTFFLYLNQTDIDTLRIKGNNEFYVNGSHPPDSLGKYQYYYYIVKP